MKNILTFEDYKKMNIRQVESVIYHQFIEEDIKDTSEVNEGFIKNAINKYAGNFIQNALADEIEKGKELEKSIKEALDGLNKGFNEIEQNIDANDKPKPNMAAIEKVKEALRIANMEEYSKRLIANLSGGQQQRVMIAKALVSDPKIIILDEPTTGIDAKSEEQLYALLNKLNKESNITIIIVSHDFAKIQQYTNKIFVVENNKVSLMKNENEV